MFRVKRLARHKKKELLALSAWKLIQRCIPTVHTHFLTSLLPRHTRSSKRKITITFNKASILILAVTSYSLPERSAQRSTAEVRSCTLYLTPSHADVRGQKKKASRSSRFTPKEAALGSPSTAIRVGHNDGPDTWTRDKCLARDFFTIKPT
jgi:hypothetical protein